MPSCNQNIYLAGVIKAVSDNRKRCTLNGVQLTCLRISHVNPLGFTRWRQYIITLFCVANLFRRILMCFLRVKRTAGFGIPSCYLAVAISPSIMISSPLRSFHTDGRNNFKNFFAVTLASSLNGWRKYPQIARFLPSEFNSNCKTHMKIAIFRFVMALCE